MLNYITFNQKNADQMRIIDASSNVCSSDLDTRAGTARHQPRHDPYRSPVDALRQPPGPCVPRWAGRSRREPLLHQLGRVEIRSARENGGRGLRRVPGPGGGTSMNTETAVLAGGCFWGVQDLLRQKTGVISTRVGYTGGDVPNATYRKHGPHD